MLSRRTFVTSAAAFSAMPLISWAQTPEAVQYDWPTIQSEAANQQRTRVVEGTGITGQPGETVTAAEDLKFPKTTENNSTMALSNYVVLSRAMGPDLPMIATDAGTGQEIWRQNRVGRLIGANRNHVAFVESPMSDGSSQILKVSQIENGEIIWELETGEIAGGAIINNQILVHTQKEGDTQTLVALALADGSSLWSSDASGFGTRIPSVFACNGSVIIGSTEPMYESIKIVAWSLETGDRLWELENEHFLTSPSFWGNEVVILAMEGLRRLDANTGEQLALIEVPDLRENLFGLAITSDATILLNFGQMTSISLQSGEVLWTRSPMQNPESYEFLVCDGVIYVLEAGDELGVSGISIRGYRIDTGEVYLDYAPVDADGNGVDIASFLVANGYLYLTTDQGIFTVLPSGKAIPKPQDPVATRTFADAELGFSYSWDESWTSTGSSFMTPNGLTFSHATNGAVAAQSAGEDRDGRRDFTRDWHANLGPDSRYITGIGPRDLPELEFVPESAEVLGVTYGATFAAPYDLLTGVRVLLPLVDDYVLILEFLQAESLFDDTIDSFATFFENLVID